MRRIWLLANVLRRTATIGGSCRPITTHRQSRQMSWIPWSPKNKFRAGFKVVGVMRRAYAGGCSVTASARAAVGSLGAFGPWQCGRTQPDLRVTRRNWNCLGNRAASMLDWGLTAEMKSPQVNAAEKLHGDLVGFRDSSTGLTVTRFPRQALLKRVTSGQVAASLLDQNAGTGAGLATTTRAAPSYTEAESRSMNSITTKRSRFRLKAFLNALHKFSLEHLGDGDPLPVVSGDTVYHDALDLAEALAAEGEDEIEVPDGSLGRLEAGLTLFASFGAFNGFDGLDCADGQHVEVPCLDEDEEWDESVIPRRRRTRAYRLKVENTTADECSCFGFVISLTADKVEIEAMGMSDVSGECELVPMADPNLLTGAMRRWVRSFTAPMRGATR